MSPIWSTEDDEILIKFVKKHEAIYNPKCPDYKDTHLKYKLWCEIGTVLKRHDIDCSKRWCYVRDYYIRRKSKRDSSGAAARRRFELLQFLDKHSKKYSSSNGDDENPGERSEGMENVDSSDGAQSQNEETDDTYEDGNFKFYENEDSNLGEDANEDPINVKKRKASDVLVQIPQKVTIQNELDENDLFFSSMAKIVKKLPSYEQAELRMQIGSLVGNAELRSIGLESTVDTKIQPRFHQD